MNSALLDNFYHNFIIVNRIQFHTSNSEPTKKLVIFDALMILGESFFH